MRSPEVVRAPDAAATPPCPPVAPAGFIFFLDWHDQLLPPFATAAVSTVATTLEAAAAAAATSPAAVASTTAAAAEAAATTGGLRLRFVVAQCNYNRLVRRFWHYGSRSFRCKRFGGWHAPIYSGGPRLIDR